ncbi:unnamed protein product [Effrenium voratum]|uniref:Uncharacterized protein n=1 Tax=Effrenium voratum TaxID=2562239 RepID=A0AA36MR44_9DINO|nr:unnamed protein product [Effrenium voratum]
MALVAAFANLVGTRAQSSRISPRARTLETNECGSLLAILAGFGLMKWLWSFIVVQIKKETKRVQNAVATPESTENKLERKAAATTVQGHFRSAQSAVVMKAACQNCTRVQS